MTKLFQKIFNRFNKKTVSEKTQSEKASLTLPLINKSAETYILVDPKNVMVDYSLFQCCKTIPVAYEQEPSETGWEKTVQLNTRAIFPLLQKMRYINFEHENGYIKEKITDKPQMRTISIIHLSDNYDLYLLPDLDRPNCVDGKIVVKKPDLNTTWSLYVTPEINREIVKRMKLSQIKSR